MPDYSPDAFPAINGRAFTPDEETAILYALHSNLIDLMGDTGMAVGDETVMASWLRLSAIYIRHHGICCDQPPADPRLAPFYWGFNEVRHYLAQLQGKAPKLHWPLIDLLLTRPVQPHRADLHKANSRTASYARDLLEQVAALMD